MKKQSRSKLIQNQSQLDMVHKKLMSEQEETKGSEIKRMDYSQTSQEEWQNVSIKQLASQIEKKKQELSQNQSYLSLNMSKQGMNESRIKNSSPTHMDISIASIGILSKQNTNTLIKQI